LSPQKREENPYTEQELELIQEAEKNPLMKRKFMKISQTANSIFVTSKLSESKDVHTYLGFLASFPSRHENHVSIGLWHWSQSSEYRTIQNCFQRK